MRRFHVGDRVRLDIPDRDDPDHHRLHGKLGTVTEVIEDDAGKETGDQRDSYLFKVDLDAGGIEHVRWRDIRPESQE